MEFLVAQKSDLPNDELTPESSQGSDSDKKEAVTKVTSKTELKKLAELKESELKDAISSQQFEKAALLKVELDNFKEKIEIATENEISAFMKPLSHASTVSVAAATSFMENINQSESNFKVEFEYTESIVNYFINLAISVRADNIHFGLVALERAVPVSNHISFGSFGPTQSHPIVQEKDLVVSLGNRGFYIFSKVYNDQIKIISLDYLNKNHYTCDCQTEDKMLTNRNKLVSYLEVVEYFDQVPKAIPSFKKILANKLLVTILKKRLIEKAYLVGESNSTYSNSNISHLSIFLFQGVLTSNVATVSEANFILKQLYPKENSISFSHFSGKLFPFLANQVLSEKYSYTSPTSTKVTYNYKTCERLYERIKGLKTDEDDDKNC